MPLTKGNSDEVVRKNIKELVRSGRQAPQAIAIALANKRKFKKMASGGLADDEYVGDDFNAAGDPQPESIIEDSYMTSKPSAAAKLDYQGMEPEGDDEQRSLIEIDRDGDYHPPEVSNPMEQDEERGFASALRRMAMEEPNHMNYAYGGNVENKKSAKVPPSDRFDKPSVVKGMDSDLENYAMGGLVDDGDEIHDKLGGKPSENMSDGIEEPGANMRAGESDLEHSVRDDYVVGSPKPPKDFGLSQEAMEAIKARKAKRRYPIV